MTIQQMMLRTSTASTLHATVSPSSLLAFGAGSTVYTDPATVTATGGSGSYTYLWERESGDDIVPSLPSNYITDFYSEDMVQFEVREALFKCTVNDGVSSFVISGYEVRVQRT